MVMAGRASDLNSVLSSNKVSLLTSITSINIYLAACPSYLPDLISLRLGKCEERRWRAMNSIQTKALMIASAFYH